MSDEMPLTSEKVCSVDNALVLELNRHLHPTAVDIFILVEITLVYRILLCFWIYILAAAGKCD